jgi:hypothetical protein
MTTRTPTGRPWQRGQSGNLRGRPPVRLAIAEQARDEVERRGLVTKLGEIAERKGSQQIKAIELLLAYAFGRPRTEMFLAEAVHRDQDLIAAFLAAMEDLPEQYRVSVSRRLLQMDRFMEENAPIQAQRVGQGL